MVYIEVFSGCLPAKFDHPSHHIHFVIVLSKFITIVEYILFFVNMLYSYTCTAFGLLRAVANM